LDAHQHQPYPDPKTLLAATQRHPCRTGGNPMTATTHDRFIVAAILIIMAVLLWILPAQAQCDPSCRDIPEPPITSTASTTLYLPQMARNWHAWFTAAELDGAIRTAGYDPAVASMHTNCYLDPSSTPPAVIRYTSCEQYYV